MLNACEGARASLNDPFAGVAQTFYRSGIPAVVAMRMSITDGAAIAFSSAFYEAIANYRPADSALGEARKAMRAKGNHIEWATPSLYLRSPDGRLFQKKQKQSLAPQDHYDDVIDGLIRGEIVVFVGPGANVCGDEHPPDDSGLASSLRSGASVELGADWGLPRVSQYIETTRNKDFLYSELHATLMKTSEPNPLHRFLATLPSLLRERVP